MLKHRAFCKITLLFLSLTISNLYAIDVLVVKNQIKYKEKIIIKNLSFKKTDKVYRHCVPVKLSDLHNNEYIATHYMSKGTILCTKDIKKYVKSSVLFNFGNLEIEKEGKVISDTNKYIKIKKPDGKVEKIYKDGRIK